MPLILIVHVNAGEEDTVSRMGVDPAEKDEALVLVDFQDVFNPVHCAAVRLASLSRNQEVGHTELVVSA